MKTLLAILLCAFSTSLSAQQTGADAAPVRFRAVDVYVDSFGVPMAAYQLDFSVTNGVAKIVGIEGGEHPAFREPPFYDPEAMQRERVIIAAFSTESADKLPAGKTRVATIHLEIIGTAKPEFEIKVVTAGDQSGRKIVASATAEERKTQ